MKTNNGTCKEMYGISRIDCDTYNMHAWRVSLCRQGKRLVKNFPDRRWDGKPQALIQAKQHRDELLTAHPPTSRKEFCNARRRNNKTGITGVYKYAKSYTLKDGTIRQAWYWEANWPNDIGESVSKRFSVNKFGDETAKQMAIHARVAGLQQVRGTFWTAERGDVQAGQDESRCVSVALLVNAERTDGMST